MKQFLIALMVILLHRESGDIDRVESCEKVGDSLLVNFGWTEELIEFPVSEYECSLYEKIGD